MKLNLPVILLNGMPLIPEATLKLEFADTTSKNIIEESELFHDKKIFVVAANKDEKKEYDLPKIGVVAKIMKKLILPNGKVRVELKGIFRASVIQYIKSSDQSEDIESFVDVIETSNIDSKTKEAVMRKLYNEIEKYISSMPGISNSVLSLIESTSDLDKIIDIMVNHMSLQKERLLEYIKEENILSRVEMLLEDMYKEEQLFSIEDNIDNKVKKELDKDQKNFFLREKMKLIQSELGELSKRDEELIGLRKSVQELNCSNEIKDKLFYEIDRYEEMSSMSPELSIVRNYIDFMLSLPWNITTKDNDSLALVKKLLDDNHFGMEKAKERIIEYLAVKKNSDLVDTPIICLVGPPGVGKTTFASSIAQSMNRNFVKISMGGIDDEAMIKGHIRTYIGSMPGKIIEGIKRAKSCNPVFLIDEIDKMGTSYKGDPGSALLEVLDSSQNKYFVDNYVGEEFDLSNTLFILTANDLSKIPSVLKDRLEIIEVSGYTEFEKVNISNKYLIPKICKSHGIKNIKISDEKLIKIIRNYTKESGVRELNRLLSKIVRKIVTNKVLNNKKITLTINNVEEYLGNEKYNDTISEDDIGVVNGLSCTVFGGDVISIETTYFKGNSELILTGTLSDEVKESAKIALSYIKANEEKFGIDYEMFKNDIHVNIPNIGIKKDGPSAGCAITTSIISALTNFKVNRKVAMTGEMTLRGNILKIGGLKEKAIGAYLNHINILFVPESNRDDYNLLPDEIKSSINFIFVKKYEEIYNYLNNIK